jgi:DNA invertase Pin-like site-specific DNA recombinase
MKKLKYSTLRVRALRTPAINSTHFSVADGLKPQPVGLYVRASSRGQRRNLKLQTAELREAAKERGFHVVSVIEVIESGYGRGRVGLAEAVDQTKKAGATVLLAWAVNRFWRPLDYKRGDKDSQLTEFDIRELKFETDGLTLATVIHPDTPEREILRLATLRGQRGTGHHGGRPIKAKEQRREELVQKARRLHANGIPILQISRKLKRARSTVRYWCE